MGKQRSERSRPLEDVGEPPPTMSEVASIITERNPPDWLVTGLRLCGGGVRQARFGSPEGTPLAEVRERLERIAVAARLLAHTITDPEMLSYLERDGFLHKVGPTWRTLTEIEPRARAIIATLSVARGRGRWGPRPTGLNAREMCALVVVEAWAAVHGEYPGPRNSKAHEAADAYWLASGGPLLGKVGSVERWSRDFQHVLNAPATFRDVARRLVQQDRPKA